MSSRRRGKNNSGRTAPDLDAEEAAFMLNLSQCLDDPEIVTKLTAIFTGGNAPVLESVKTLTDTVKDLKDKLSQKDKVISELRGEVESLRASHDALDQYGRRADCRISGIAENWGNDTTPAVVHLANKVLMLDPPLENKDIEISHRLPKPPTAKAASPRPVIVRFKSRDDRFRFISQRSKLKKHHEDGGPEYFINENLTTFRAQLFATTRKLYTAKHISQCWTYNGNIKVKMNDGVIKSVASLNDLSVLLPRVDINKFSAKR